MLNLDMSPAYYAPVRLPVLDAQGQLADMVFDAYFRRLGQTEIDKLLGDKDLVATDAVRQVVLGWKLVVDGQGLPVPFSADNLGRLLDIPGMAAAILQGFVRSWAPTEGASSAAGAEAAQKN